MQKRLLSIFLVTIMSLSLMACNTEKTEVEANDLKDTETEVVEVETEVEDITIEKIDIQVGTLKGPTGMGMVALMADEDTANHYEFELFSSPDELVGKVISGELDIIAVPTNLASVLYNRTEGGVQLAAVNTLGVLYVLENGDTVNSLEDLKGLTLNTSGKGASPDFVMQYLLNEKGLVPDVDVMLDYKLDHADLATALVAGDVSLALLPQPHVTTALMRNPDLRIALDITKEWENINDATGELPMGVLIVQKAFAEANPEAMNAFLDEYKASVAFVNENVTEAAALIAQFEILPNAQVAEKAIPLSNIVYMDAMDAKASLEAFFKVLYDFEPKSVGGKLADEGFYYQR